MKDTRKRLPHLRLKLDRLIEKRSKIADHPLWASAILPQWDTEIEAVRAEIARREQEEGGNGGL